MTTTTKNKEHKEQKEKKDNIFLEILYNILIQLPIVIITWLFSQFTSEG